MNTQSQPPATPRLEAVSFDALPGWQLDDFTDFKIALAENCTAINKRNAGARYQLADKTWQAGDMQRACTTLQTTSDNNLRSTIETLFTPYRVLADDKPDGLFTGYYEAELNGSRRQHGRYQTPLYQRPDDLVMVELGDFRDSLKGQRIAGRIVGGALKPYETRADLTQNPPSTLKPLVYVDDAIDAFFLHIQGSGIVTLDDGRTMRVGYDGQNGHVYHAIGKTLVERGALTMENVSMQSIAEYLRAHPEQRDDVLNQNPSFIFFRALENETGPLGSLGVPLTPLRSLAVDRTIIPLGSLLWLDAAHPTQPSARLQRLMLAQDTGGAINGIVRGDVFWGHGVDAAHQAGLMKSTGSYYILLPR